MSATYQLFATVPKGMVAVLLAELADLGLQNLREQPAGVEFSGDLEAAYRVCLWSRVASRVLLMLGRFPAADADALYRAAQQIDWRQHLAAEGTLAVDFTGRSNAINNTQFGALKIKDAVVDQLRDTAGARPSVDTQQPDLRINAHLHREEVTLSIDLSGESLHRRGYRREQGPAPMKENLAAAILLRCGWPEIAASGGGLVDPMCGSGTFLVEGAMIAGDIAPGSLRQQFGFQSWRQHDEALWQRLLGEAQTRCRVGRTRMPAIYGYDISDRAVSVAQANVMHAGLADFIQIACGDVAQLCRPPELVRGLVIVNPPYGDRMGDQDTLGALYQQLSARMKAEFEGWQAAVFTGSPELAKQMGIRARHQHTMFNGALECRLLRFELDPQWYMTPGGGLRAAQPEQLGPGAEMLANRLRKNLKELRRWAAREGISCYRLYDADLPEYNLAIDLYQGEHRWVHVQEYQAPKKVDPRRARSRLKEALAVVPQTLEIPPEQMFFKVRQRQKGAAQYQKKGDQNQFYEVQESGHTFLVNFTDYLDTGLFLDHRITRQKVSALAGGKHFLNLFAYTGSASVYAAAGGAASTTTVDMSRTYLEWAERNMAMNGFVSSGHVFEQADCMQWLAERARSTGARRYGLIFLDPPTFSTSKRMEKTFDVQRDHVVLLKQAIALLDPDGVLIFSNNFRRFKMDAAALTGIIVEDITQATIPKDFARNPRIHNCWLIRHPS